MSISVTVLDPDELRMLQMCSRLAPGKSICIETIVDNGKRSYSAWVPGVADGKRRRSIWMALKSLWRELGGTPSSNGLELLREKP